MWSEKIRRRRARAWPGKHRRLRDQEGVILAVMTVTEPFWVPNKAREAGERVAPGVNQRASGGELNSATNTRGQSVYSGRSRWTASKGRPL